MAKPSGKLPFYKALVNRFSHLAANASEDEEEKRKAEERKAREEGDEEEDEEEAGISEDEKEARHARNEKRRAKAATPTRADEEDGDGDDDESPEAKARAAERARWGEVLGSPEAKGRVPLACSLLADTGMSPEKIRAALLASPVESRQGLAARMAAVQRPDVGSGPGASAAAAAAAGSPKSKAAEIIASYKKVVG